MSFLEFGRRAADVPEHARLRGLEVGNPHPQYSLADHSHTELVDLLFDVGDIRWRAHDTPPSDAWVVANGQAISRSGYPAAFTLFDTAYGSGDGSTTFNIPNLVGARLEGAADNSTRAQKAADSHSHTKSGSVSSGSASHSHGASTSIASATHNHVYHDAGGGDNGTSNHDANHSHPIGSDGAAHAHGDTIAYAAGSVGSVTKLVPFIKVA